MAVAKFKVALMFRVVVCFRMNLNIPCNSAQRQVYRTPNDTYSRGCNEHLVPISIRSASMLTDNWIACLSQRKDDNTPRFTLTTVFDMKLFISVNRHADDMVFLAWSPRMANGDIVFLIGGEMVGSELQVHRFSQSPHFKDMLSINTLDIVTDMNCLDSMCHIDFTELHSYDDRYLRSWNFHTR